MNKRSHLRYWLALFWLARTPPSVSSWPFRVGRLASLVLYGYLGLAFILMTSETELVFRPKRYPDFWNETPSSAGISEVAIPCNDGTIHGYWLEPDGWTPTQGALLHCHGHGCNVSHLTKSALCWREIFGRAVLLFDYPGYGKSDGEPSEDGCYTAATSALDWLTQARHAQDVVVYGHSMGGAVAIELASRRRVRALLVSSSFTTMPDAASVLLPIYPTSWLMRNRFGSLERIAGCSTPLFLAHGTHDGRIPLDQGQRLYARSPANVKELFSVEGAGHDLEHLPQVFEAAKRFVDRVESTAQ